MSTLPPLPPGTSLAPPEEENLPPLPPGTSLAPISGLPPLPTGTTLASNPLRDALIKRSGPGLKLSMLGPEAIEGVAQAHGFPGERPMPWFTVPVAHSWAPNNERVQEIITHPFDAMGEVFSRGLRTTGQAIAEKVAPAAGPMLGQALSTATFGAVDPGIGDPLLRGAAEVPADMAQAIAGDPAMTALVAAGMAVPGGAALAPFVHAAPTAYFGAEGLAGLAPMFGRTEEQRAQPSPLGLLRPGVWDTLPPEQKKDTFRGIFGSTLMLGLPALHLGKEMRSVGKNLTSTETGPMSLVDNPRNYASVEPILDAMEATLDGMKFLTADQRARAFLPANPKWLDQKPLPKLDIYPRGGLEQISQVVSTPTFFRDAMERAAPAWRVADLVVQVPDKFYSKGLTDLEKEKVGIRYSPTAIVDGELRRKVLVSTGQFEVDSGAVSQRPAWYFPPVIRQDLPMGTEEGFYKILGAQAKMAGLSDAEIAANAIISKRASFGWESNSTLDVGHFWGGLTDRAQSDPTFILNQFIGEKGIVALSKQPGFERLREAASDASAMLSRGEDPETVRKITGMIRGADDKLRFEVSDKEMAYKVEPWEWADKDEVLAGRVKPTRLGDVIDHPLLFKVFPDLADVEVVFDRTPPHEFRMGSFDHNNNRITVTGNADIAGTDRNTLAHEIQHWIQLKEGFAQGGDGAAGYALLPPKVQKELAVQYRTKNARIAKDLREEAQILQKLRKGVEGLDEYRKAARDLALTEDGISYEDSVVARGNLAVERYAILRRLGIKKGTSLWDAGERIFTEIGFSSKSIDDILKRVTDKAAEHATTVRVLDGAAAMGDYKFIGRVLGGKGELSSLYERLAGESEARLTGSRLELDDLDRRAEAPKLDVPREDMLFHGVRPDTLFQAEGGRVLGSTTRFLNGQSMIRLFEGAHVGTLVHETSHFFRSSLYMMKEYAREDARPRFLRDLSELEKWAGVKDGKWDERAEEMWARGAENYLRSGKAPVPGLQGLFDQFKGWLRAIYDDTAAAGMAKFSPEVEEFFDTYILAEPVSPAKQKSWTVLRRMQQEDQEAYEAALALRDIPKAKGKLDEKFQAFERWIALSRQERVLLGLEDQQKWTAARASWGSAVAGDRGHAAYRRAGEYVQKIEGLVWPDGKGKAEGDALALLTSPSALADWKAKLQEGIKAAKYGNPYRQRINNLLGFFESEARSFRDAAQANDDAAQMAGENLGEFTAAERDLKRKRASVRLLVREMRKATGEALPDPATERAAVLKLAERYYASPRLLTELVDRTLVPRMEQLSKAILTAEATYRARTEAIAIRGNLGDAWGKSPIEDTARAELLEKIRQDIAAQRTALRQIDGMAALMDGEEINPADIFTDLNEGFREVMGLEGITEDTKLAIGEREADRLMEGEMDATTRRAMEEYATPLSRLRENFKPLLMGIRYAAREVFDPMSALNPYTYDPGRRVNKVLKALGLKEEKPHTMTAQQMKEARDLFVQADGAVNYWDKVLSPQWMDVVYRAFPKLEERQLMTINRDTGSLDFSKMESGMRDREQKAHAKWEQAKRGGDPVEIREAQRLYGVAVRRTNRARGHVGVRGEWLSPRMSAALGMLASSMDALQNIGARAGLWEPEAFRENYLPRIYRPEDVERVKDFYRDSVLLGGPNKHGFQRVFDTMVEAYVIEGLKPATLDLAFLVDQYGRSLTESIQKRQLVSELQRVAPDMFEWVDKGRKSAAKDFMDISGFVSHAIIRPEKNTPDARFHAHRSIGVLLENMSKESVWSKKGPLYAPLRAAKAVNMWLKKIQLAIDLYHLWQVTRVAMGSGVYGGAGSAGLPFRDVLKELNQLDPKSPKHALIKEMIHEGLDVSSGEWARRQIYKEVESQIIGKISPGAKAYHWLGHEFETMSRYMWEEYVPALKMLTAARQLERLLNNPKTSHLDRATLVRAAATVANDKFGSATWSLHGRSKTLEDTLSIAFLAPQWLESRFRNVLGVAKKGPEGALWRDYWLGEGVMDTVRGKPVDLETAPKRWATGYVVQGMILSAVGNMMVETMWPDGEEKEKAKAERGANWFFSTTIPAQDKRGFPLHVSPFATRDYIVAFVEDLMSVAPALRWYKGRQGPFLRAATTIYTGKDFAGRPLRGESLSLESLGMVLDTALPWRHNIVSGSLGEVVTADEPGFSFWRTAARLTGGHTTSSWLPQVMDKAEFFKAQSQQWNRHGQKEWAKWYYSTPGLGDILLTAARARAMRHNHNLDVFIEDVKKDDRMRATLGPTLEKLNSYHMLVPPARK